MKVFTVWNNWHNKNALEVVGVEAKRIKGGYKLAERIGAFGHRVIVPEMHCSESPEAAIQRFVRAAYDNVHFAQAELEDRIRRHNEAMAFADSQKATL